jgi:ketosteroid isomerase-like protein
MPAVEADVVADVADRLFAAIENGDAATVEQLWDDDVLVWKSGEPVDREKKRALRVIAWFIDTTTERRYEILDLQFFDGGFVQQHILHATARTADRSRCGSVSLSSWEPTA